MAWTKEQFIEFCQRCGVDHKKALKEGQVRLSFNVTGPTLGSIAARQIRKNRAIKAVTKIQDSLREPDKAMVLAEEVCGQDEGMVSPAARFRVSIIGLRVRPIDPDNFTAGCKGIIDGIVRSRLIEGDDWNTLEIACSQRKVGTWSEEGTLIEIEDLT
jgi:hypothetical protein